MLTISAPTADLIGHVVITSETADSGISGGNTMRRRISRAATLDGGSAFVDGGFSHTDSDLSISWEPGDEAAETRLRRLFELYERVVVSVRQGVYLAAARSYKPGAKQSTLTAYVVTKLSA